MNNIHGRSSLMLGMIHQRDNIVDQRELSLLRYLSIYDARNGAQLIIWACSLFSKETDG